LWWVFRVNHISVTCPPLPHSPFVSPPFLLLFSLYCLFLCYKGSIYVLRLCDDQVQNLFCVSLLSCLPFFYSRINVKALRYIFFYRLRNRLKSFFKLQCKRLQQLIKTKALYICTELGLIPFLTSMICTLVRLVDNRRAVSMKEMSNSN